MLKLRRSMQGEAASDTRGVIPRVVALLEGMASGNRPWGVSDLSRRTGIPVQSAHRLLVELSRGGLSIQDPTTKRWSLGPLAISLGAAARRQISLLSVARPVLESLAATSEETIVLTLRDGAFGTYVDIVESPHPLRLIESVGLRMPLSVGASRLVILAFLPDHQRKHVIATLRLKVEGLSSGQLESQCEEIRQRGFAMSVGAVTPHTVGVAVPVIVNAEPIASLLVAGPESRLTVDRCESVAQLALEHAHQLALVIAPGHQELMGRR